jgi:hypothetical protein
VPANAACNDLPKIGLPGSILNACCKAENGSYFLVERGASCGGIPLSDLIDCTGGLAPNGTFSAGKAANANRALFGGSLVHDADGNPAERCRRASFLDTAKVVGDSATQTWYMEAVGCSVAPLSLPTLLKILVGSAPGSTAWHNARGSIVFIGDSHTRNSFSALVAGIRGLHNAVEEFHGTNVMKKVGFMLRYVIYRDTTTIRDSLELFNNTDVEPPPVRCPPDDDSGLFCVDVLFVWAATWVEMIKRLPVITKYTPTFVVGCTGNTYVAPRPPFENIALDAEPISCFSFLISTKWCESITCCPNIEERSVRRIRLVHRVYPESLNCSFVLQCTHAIFTLTLSFVFTLVTAVTVDQQVREDARDSLE